MCRGLIAAVSTTETPRVAARSRRAVVITVVVGALGYFVDIYDLLLFAVVRTRSLVSLGVPASQTLPVGLHLLSDQMWGLLVGGIVWGILGDKRGRLSVLFGSILLYSVANLANAFVHTVTQYEIARFIAGIGLAGELGAAITLVSESMPARSRGYGTAAVAGIGLLGAVVAALVGKHLDWRHAYILGGCLGLVLLGTRLTMFESGMYARTADDPSVRRGDVTMLLRPFARLARYARCVLIGVPIWFVIGILVTAAPEFATAFHATGPVTAGDGILWSYVGLAVGDLSSGALSQVLQSRRKVVLGYMLLTTALIAAYLTLDGPSPAQIYALCGAMGFAIGYWAVFVTIAAEQFGTNLRATVTTTVPNFVRGSVPLLTGSFLFLRGRGMTIVQSAATVGAVSLALAFASLWWMEETYGRELDFME